jgi:hypothetical protein
LRPYPTLKKLGRLWLKSGRYRFAYRPTTPPIIAAIETVDTPTHL